MPGKAPPIKLLQLKLPSYSGRVTPEPYETWLKEVVKLNDKKNRSQLTEVNIKGAWTGTLRKLHLDDRVEEMNSKTGRSAMQDILSKLQSVDQRRTSEVQNGRERWQAPSVFKDLDISEYRIPTLGPKHLEAVKYSHFAKQVQQANKGKPFNREVVDACFGRMVNDLLRKMGAGSRATPLLNEAKSVMTQANTYWTSLESSEL
jgi:hypothetical protein